jgi:hypothetical protein
MTQHVMERDALCGSLRWLARDGVGSSEFPCTWPVFFHGQPHDELTAGHDDQRRARRDREKSSIKFVERIRRLSEQDWRRTAEHGEYSHYSVFIMFRHLALRDFFHGYRIEELLLKKEWARG